MVVKLQRGSMRISAISDSQSERRAESVCQRPRQPQGALNPCLQGRRCGGTHTPYVRACASKRACASVYVYVYVGATSLRRTDCAVAVAAAPGTARVRHEPATERR